MQTGLLRGARVRVVNRRCQVVRVIMSILSLK